MTKATPLTPSTTLMHDELLFDKIEAYLKGQLPSSEAAAFEAEIAADPELAMLVKTHRLERQGLEWLVERDLLAKMNAWERESNGERDSGETSAANRGGAMRVSFVRRWWAAGAAAALMLGVFGWWLLQPQADIGGPPAVVTVPKTKPPASATPKPKPRPSQKPPASQQEDAAADDQVAESPAPSPRPNTPAPTVNPPAPASTTVDYSALAATYYRRDDFLKETQGATGGDAPGYGQALDSYKSGKYTDVEKLLKPALKNMPNGLKAKELLAHSLYQRGQYGEALNWFRQLAGSGDKALAERSEWAAALTLLHQMPAQKAQLERALDKIIAKPGHTFYAKAKELRGRIR